MIHPALVLPPPADLAAFCARHGIAKLALFGSALTDRFRPDSDVDVLVWFLPGRTPDLITLSGMELSIAELLGRRVDFVDIGSLSKYIKNDVLASMEVIYSAA